MSAENSGLITKLSDLIGTNEAALSLLLTILAGYPLALIHRKFFYGKAANVQHLYLALSGLLLGYWNYGLDIFHVVIAVISSYLVLLIVGGTSLSVGIVFVSNMAYLLFGYHYMGTDTYDINWTMPQCILVLRLIGIAYDLYDGHQPLEALSSENKKTALNQCPTIFEMLGHTLFPSSFLIGPQFPMKRYQSFIAGEFGPKGGKPDCIKAALRRFLLGVFYLIIFQILGVFVSDSYMFSDEFRDVSFLKRLFLMGVWGRFTLYKYISCWLLTEGGCILFGMSFNGKSETGETLWNGVENVNLATFENTTEFTHYIQSFNMNTNHWVLQYIYKRLKFLNNRHISQFAVLLFLAIWHGFHSGYYVCFFFEFMIVNMERDVKGIVKSNEFLKNFFGSAGVGIILQVILRLYTFVFMGWCLFPFALLTYDRYWQAFSNVWYCGIITFVLYPLVYSPILKIIFKKTKKE